MNPVIHEVHNIEESMDLNEAQKIVSDCTDHTWFQMGLRNDPPPDISGYSLQQMIDANEMVKDHNNNRTDGCQSLQLADRLIAALFALTHFCADNSQPVAINKDKALVIIPLPENYFNDDE